MRPTALGPVLRLLAVLQAPLPLLHVWAPAGLAPAARAETERTDAHRSGRLLMWNLRHLTSPSAPSPTRFDSGPSLLQVLAGPRPSIPVTAAAPTAVAGGFGNPPRVSEVSSRGAQASLLAGAPSREGSGALPGFPRSARVGRRRACSPEPRRGRVREPSQG